VLGEDTKDTRTTKVALEEANGALVVQMKELKANAERAIAEAMWQKEKEEKEAPDKSVGGRVKGARQGRDKNGNSSRESSKEGRARGDDQ
jgi:hypothetical protein